MKKFITSTLAVLAVSAFAQDVPRTDRNLNVEVPAGATVVMRNQLGSGTPGVVGSEAATHLGGGIYHAPQYLPYAPTAGTIYPRVVTVQCDKQGTKFVCDGFDWQEAYGRAEYLFIRPVVKAAPAAPQIITVPGPERVILKEVPVKPKSE